MNLEHVALERFDKLVAKGELLWRDAPPVILETEPFNVRLRDHIDITLNKIAQMAEHHRSSSA